jgi:hypothetical protein
MTEGFTLKFRTVSVPPRSVRIEILYGTGNYKPSRPGAWELSCVGKLRSYERADQPPRAPRAARALQVGYAVRALALAC